MAPGSYYKYCDTTTGDATWNYTTWGTSDTSSTSWDQWASLPVIVKETIPARLPAEKRSIELPDGAVLHISAGGNYRIDDSKAQVVYEANNRREFSPHLNASDLLAEFIKYVRSLGVDSNRAMDLPIKLFVAWLIIEAAERDGDPIPGDIQPIASSREIATILHPQCLQCGRFIKQLHAQNGFLYCNPEHARLAIAA